MSDGTMREFRLVPGVKNIVFADGICAITEDVVLTVSCDASALGAIIEEEHRNEWDKSVTLATDGTGYTFQLGFGGVTPPACSDMAGHNSYKLECSEGGLSACAGDHAGLVHAWQTAKQILRECAAEIPCFQIEDSPDLPWRIYHLDLKGTRRPLKGLYEILPRLAEFKINAVLVEYEDYVILEKHPDIAIADAIAKDEWREWIQAAGGYGISVIPLVQTLGHWQYILNKPAYAHLTENPDDPSEGCSTNPGTWDLARDLLEEMLELHPDAPFIHVGLDETAHVGTCPQCRERIGDGSRHDLYVEWLNRVAEFVIERGSTPMAWGDITIAKLSADQIARLNKELVLVDWGYAETGPVYPTMRYKGTYVSREWLRRPNSEISTVQQVPFRPGVQFLEDMDAEDMERLRPHIDNDRFPMQIRRSFGTALLSEMGFSTMGVSGIRISAHGTAMPLFITGQLNTIACADMAMEFGGLGVIGSSWARGHSLTTQNAHPDLDWYGIATLGACAWQQLPLSDLRSFDACFAFQFFGHDDGTIGDLYYLCERTHGHVDHVMSDYLDYIAETIGRLKEDTARNQVYLDLLLKMVELRQLRFRGEFALLEVEYFYPIWDKIPKAMSARIVKDIDSVVEEMNEKQRELGELYSQTMLAVDAIELAATQIEYLRDSLLDKQARVTAIADSAEKPVRWIVPGRG